MRRALITGITGQDGSYLTELLLAKGYEVHGLVRRTSTLNTDRIDHILHTMGDNDSRLVLHSGDVTDGTGLRRVVEAARPDEIYNLAAQSHVGVSFDLPEYTADADAIGTLRVLEAAREYERGGTKVRIYQAGTSEMFGGSPPPQSEQTPFRPRSPYAASKLAAHWYATNYREAYGMFVVNGIMFNHESPRRGETFVTRKVTRAAARIHHGLQQKLYLGNLDARRDWGFAGDFVKGMWMALQHDKADDFVFATGTSRSVRELLDAAFGRVGLSWKDHVFVDPSQFRPTEVDALEGDASKAKTTLKWEPAVGFEELVAMMVDHDLRLAAKDRALREAGYSLPPRSRA